MISITNYNNRNKPASAAATTVTTTESESNQQLTTSSSKPLNKKLRLLENLETDHGSTTVTADGNDDDTGKTLRILQEVPAYLGPTVLTEDEKMSAMLYWKRHCEAYPHLSQIAKVYLMLSASSVPIESICSLLLVW